MFGEGFDTWHAGYSLPSIQQAQRWHMAPESMTVFLYKQDLQLHVFGYAWSLYQLLHHFG